MRIEIQDGLQTMDPIMRQTSERVESNQRILLLFTTTGYNAQDFVAAAKKLGIEVVAGTDRCHMLKNP